MRDETHAATRKFPSKKQTRGSLRVDPEREDEEEARALERDQTPEPEDDPPLVFLGDLDGRRSHREQAQANEQDADEFVVVREHDGAPLHLASHRSVTPRLRR
jgi:hypothetical protein